MSLADTSKHESICGFGASVFVDEPFVEAELASPVPGLNSRVISAIVSGRHIVFDRRKIGNANADGGLNVVVLVGRWDPGIQDSQLIQQVQAQLSISFVEEHAGYLLKRILNDLSTPNDLRFASQVPYMRIHARFASDRALSVVEKDDIRNSQGSILVKSFSDLRPKLQLTPAEQELLILAQESRTVSELASLLHITTRAVKARWANIFSRVARIEPEVIPAFQPARSEVDADLKNGTAY